MGAFISGIGDQFFGSQPPAQQTYQPTQATQGNPSVGIGFGPAPIEQNPMDILGGGLNFGGMGFGIQGNQPAPTNNFGGGLAGAAMNAIQSNQPAPQPMPTSGMGGGKGMLPPSFGQFQPGGTPPMFIDGNGNPTNDHGGGRVNMNINPFNPAYTPPQGPQIGSQGGQTPQDLYNQRANILFGGGGNSIYQPNFMPQGPQIGFGPAPIEQNPMDVLQSATNMIGGSPLGFGSGMQQPAPQPVNRFAPPNAPGVRQQPRTAPRAGIPVQSARTVQPNRFTRSRTR